MLAKAIFLVETKQGALEASLPEALASLCDGSLIGFDGLAAHQRQAWDQFLWQLAALALVRSGEAGAAEDDAAWRALADPAAWRQRLEALTPGCVETAWSLVVPDLTQPAFLQPPIPAGRLDRFSVAGITPDEIDVLITAKQHDVKAARAGSAELQHWLFALVTLQTRQGYSGRGNFGIARMNGGFGSRPMLALTPGRDMATQFRRGVQTALRARSRALDEGPMYAREGHMLLWLQPWDREAGIGLHELDPLFIEVCRRVRLVRDAEGRITAWGRPSETARVLVSKESKGRLSDPWTPITQDASLTVGGAGFDYRLLARLLTKGEFTPPASMSLRGDDPPGMMWLRASVLVRGQGKTEGLHERWLRVTSDKINRRDPGEAERLAHIGKAMVSDADGARKALRLGLLNLLQGGGDKLDFEDDRPREWLAAFEHQVDGMFFDHLFARAASSDDEPVEIAWRRALVDVAQRLFDKALTRLTPPDCRRERARAIAEAVFFGLLVKAELTAVVTHEEHAS